ncbi:MAG: OmpA family protein [Nitrospirota bacterium]|nr:OmpA family protein [Nitrospirota bacterium]
MGICLLFLFPVTIKAHSFTHQFRHAPYPIEQLDLPVLALPELTSQEARFSRSPKSEPPPPITAGHLYFDQTRQSFSADNTRFLKHIMTTLETNNWKLHIEGLCDGRGTRAYNMAYAHQQATQVYNYLTDLGINKIQLSSTGLAELGHAAHDTQLQHAFIFLALGETRQGCITRLQLEAGSEWQQAEWLIQHNPFLQRIHLTEVESRRQHMPQR